jgi:hypothetical protein
VEMLRQREGCPSSTSHSTCVRALSPERANISGGAFRRVAVLAIEAASALGPNTSVVFNAGASKPNELGSACVDGAYGH